MKANLTYMDWMFGGNDPSATEIIILLWRSLKQFHFKIKLQAMRR